jgi:hypothetical protein
LGAGVTRTFVATEGTPLIASKSSDDEDEDDDDDDADV